MRTEGPLGLTRGLGACMTREVPGNSVYFTTYEVLQKNIMGRGPNQETDRGILAIAANAASAIFCGGIAGITVSMHPSCERIFSLTLQPSELSFHRFLAI